MSTAYNEKRPADVATARRLLDEAGFTHWTVVEAPGYGADPHCLRGERTAPAPKQEVIHQHPEVLVQLVREVEARIPAKSPAVASGTADTTTY